MSLSAPQSSNYPAKHEAGERRLVLILLGVLIAFVAVICLALLVLGLPRWYQYLQGPCPFPCTDVRLTVTQWMRAHQVGISPATYAAVFVILQVILAILCYVVAGAILWRRPSDRMAYLVALFLLLLAGTFTDADELATGRVPLLFPVATLFNAVGFLLFPLLLYLYPDGHFVPRWTRWMMAFTVLVYLLFQSPLSLAIAPAAPLFVALYTLPPIFSQIYRYRRVSGAVERQQVKWVVYGMVVAGVTYFLVVGGDIVIGMGGRMAPAPKLLMEGLFYLGMMLIPITFGFAILRYRLFDINVIIRRTLQYALVTLLLLVTYAGLVIILQRTLLAATGRNGSLAVVLSTLAIAALFNPLRHRVQSWVDRRFYRSAYDAEEIVATFGRTAQNEGDLSLLTEEMLTAIRQSMQPTFVGLWLAQPHAPEGEESGP